jgi:hypothetical protein
LVDASIDTPSAEVAPPRDAGDSAARCTEDVRPRPAADCPIVLPRDGTPCRPTKAERCEYAGCEPTLSDRARCSAETGKWIVSAAACATGPDRCPVEQPLGGSVCTVIGELCWYDDECLRRTRAECDPTTRKWTVERAASCPDANRCPTVAPMPGTKCGACAGTKFSCEYRNECGLYDTLTCDGASGSWAAVKEPCVTEAPCPTVQPAIGASCGSIADGTHCAWTNACGTIERPDGSVDDMDCVSGKWRMFHRGSCSAPPCSKPLGDATGSSCTGADETCVYPVGGGCSISCTCIYYGSFFGKLHCSYPPCAGDTMVGK